MSATAEVVIKGRNELSYAVKQAQRDLRGLVQQGELIGKVFRGGAIVGAAMAFERLAENAEAAAKAIGDQGTARALGQLNQQIDRLKSKGLNVIGQVLGNVYGAFSGDRVLELQEQISFLKQMEGRSFVAAGYKDIGTGFFTAAEGAAKLLELEKKLFDLRTNTAPLGSFARTQAMSRGGGSKLLTETPAASVVAQAAAVDTAISREVQNLIGAGEAWRDLQATASDAMEQVGRDVDQYVKQGLENLEPAMQAAESEFSVFAEEAGRQMQQSLAQFLFNPFEDGLKGMAQGFANMLRQMVAQLLAQQILRSFFNWGSGLGGGIGEFFTGLGKSLDGTRAGGGPVMAGGAYLVGEHGPEIFTPSASGMIHAGAGGMTVAPVYNIDARGATQDVIKMLPMILEENTRRTVELTKASVRDDIKRYGKVR